MDNACVGATALACGMVWLNRVPTGFVGSPEFPIMVAFIGKSWKVVKC